MKTKMFFKLVKLLVLILLIVLIQIKTDSRFMTALLSWLVITHELNLLKIEYLFTQDSAWKQRKTNIEKFEKELKEAQVDL